MTPTIWVFQPRMTLPEVLIRGGEVLSAEAFVADGEEIQAK